MNTTFNIENNSEGWAEIPKITEADLDNIDKKEWNITEDHTISFGVEARENNKKDISSKNNKKLFSISYSSLATYRSCKERYRVTYLDPILDKKGNKVQNCHYYAAIGSAVQSIFEGVVNAWNKPESKVKTCYFNYCEDKFYSILFKQLDKELDKLHPFIKDLTEHTEGFSIALPDKEFFFIKEFKEFPIAFLKYGRTFREAVNNLFLEVKKLYREPLKTFIKSFLAKPNIKVECEVKIFKELPAGYVISGYIDFLVTNTDNNKKIVLDGKRKYNKATNKNEQLLIYAHHSGAFKAGFYSYKENQIYWTLPEITKESYEELESEMNEMYLDITKWDIKEPQQETSNSSCIYCDKQYSCKEYLKKNKKKAEEYSKDIPEEF